MAECTCLEFHGEDPLCPQHGGQASRSRALAVRKLKYQMAVAALKPDHPLKSEGQDDG